MVSEVIPGDLFEAVPSTISTETPVLSVIELHCPSLESASECVVAADLPLGFEQCPGTIFFLG
jgi:hypothetical protein